MKTSSEYAKHTLTWLLMAGVVLVFFSPIVQLEPTALRAARMASAVMLSFMTAAAAVAAPSGSAAAFRFIAPHSYAACPISIIDLDCARLC